jgi:hypothetical protein
VPAHTSYVHWGLAGSGAAELSFALHVLSDPGQQVGLYFAPFSGMIDDTQFYFGIQTDVNNPQVGSTGKGFIFSHWGSFDAADTRVAPGGFIELGTHEGKFIGVRRNLAWQARTYTLVLKRAEPAGNGDWFELTVTDETTKEQTAIGGLRVARKDPATPAAIQPFGTAFTEVYAGATSYAAVPQWRLAVAARADGAPAVSARSEYPAFPTAEYPNTDVSYDAASGLVHLVYGGQTPRCHPAGPLF